MRSMATPREVCGAGTDSAFDVGSIANSLIGPTFHDPPAHSNHPTEPFLKGMHTLARGCPALRWLPRVRAPKTRFIPEGNAYGGPDFDMARKNTPPRWDRSPKESQFRSF